MKKNREHLSSHDMWVVKSVTATVELLGKMITEMQKMRKEIEEIKNPKIESMLNMKRGNPFKEGTN